MTGINTAASRLAHLGHPLIPLHSIRRDGRCSCGRACDSPGKHPRTPNGLKDASAEPSMVAGWWRRWPTANIGLLTGEVADLLGVDLDGPEGIAAFEALVAAHGLPTTRWAITGGGGRHVYLRHPGGALGNTCRRLGPGIDTRGDHGYVVAPPSTHVSGGVYSWANQERVAPCPVWLVDLLRPPAPAPRPRQNLPAQGSLDRRLAALAQTVATAPVGQRNHALNWAAYRAREIVDAGGDIHHVAGVLLDAALASGLGETEARRTIESGLGTRSAA